MPKKEHELHTKRTRHWLLNKKEDQFQNTLKFTMKMKIEVEPNLYKW
jgi:hypothetical protein